jgi:hypothetical protein
MIIEHKILNETTTVNIKVPDTHCTIIEQASILLYHKLITVDQFMSYCRIDNKTQ